MQNLEAAAATLSSPHPPPFPPKQVDAQLGTGGGGGGGGGLAHSFSFLKKASCGWQWHLKSSRDSHAQWLGSCPKWSPLFGCEGSSLPHLAPCEPPPWHRPH